MLHIDVLKEALTQEAEVIAGLDKLNPVYARAMLELSYYTAVENVTVREIRRYANGFQVRFEDWKAPDAICHDGSYGHTRGMWETYKFPWDGKDVFVMDARTLAKRLHALKNGEDWKEGE